MYEGIRSVWTSATPSGPYVTPVNSDVTLPLPLDLITWDVSFGPGINFAIFGTRSTTSPKAPGAGDTADGQVTMSVGGSNGVAASAVPGFARVLGNNAFGVVTNGQKIGLSSFTLFCHLKLPPSYAATLGFIQSWRNDNVVSPIPVRSMGCQWYLTGTGTQLGFGLRTNGPTGGDETFGEFNLPINVLDDQWHDYCITVQRGGLARYYLDGVQFATLDVSPQTGNVSSGTNRFAVCAIDDGAASYYFPMPCTIDEVARWMGPDASSGALTAQQVFRLHQLRLSGVSIRGSLGF